MAATVSCAMAMGRIGQSKPGWGLSRSVAPKVRDRGDVVAEEKIRFTSSILPKWARRTKSLDALLPILYPRGVSTGDFQEALGADEGSLSETTAKLMVFKRVNTAAKTWRRLKGE